MDVRKRKWLTYLIAFCMTLSVLTGIEPASFLVHAQSSVHQPVVKDGDITFSITTPNAYAVYLAGELNGWKDKDLLLEKKADNLWTITLSTDKYEALNQPKSEYKFITYIGEDSSPQWEEGENHVVYREAFEFVKKDLNVQKGARINLPGGVYYNEAKQEAEEIAPKDITYMIQGDNKGVTLEKGQLQITDYRLQMILKEVKSQLEGFITQNKVNLIFALLRNRFHQ